MKNNILVGALIASLLSFIVYTSTYKDAENRELNVVQVKKKGTVKNKLSSASQDKEPNVNSIEYSNHVTSKKGSNKTLVKAIKKAMGEDASYQVAAYSLTQSSFAEVKNTSSAQKGGKIFELYLLMALYYQEKNGKMGSSTAIKVTKADHATDQGVSVGISYGPSYLRQQMLKGSTTAANALLRTIGAKTVLKVIKKAGATNTKITGNFKGTVGTTTASDLAAVMTSIYKGKVIGASYGQQLMVLLTGKNALTSKLSGTIYQIASDNLAAAIVQNSGHNYVIAAWTDKTDNYAKLGSAIGNFMNKQ